MLIPKLRDRKYGGKKNAVKDNMKVVNVEHMPAYVILNYYEVVHRTSFVLKLL